MKTVGYYSLSDMGYSPDDYEDTGRPHCAWCGAFLPAPETFIITYGEPGHTWEEPRDGSPCGKCGAVNYLD